ncbi:rpl36 (nucleomorph) [Hemiselmis andersenii]|uniref:Rpl36 n=1 Tax=Hemiselmis andersenii TaxID=464988 RepID=A9BL83_HEMAN|nr:rpl36 [Hemiselmis andersenii]ABW98266.1 rpl36 [Hemiselmis andersenii]
MWRKNLKKITKKNKNPVSFGHGVVKKFIKNMVGLSPLEKKIYENLNLGKDKKALKTAKKKIGDIKRAKKKEIRLIIF